MKDPQHLALLRSLPCAVATHGIVRGFPVLRLGDGVCFGAVQAHHRTGAGLALKASDREAFPLCVAHHRQFHDASGVFKGWTREQRNDWQDRMVELYKPDE